jgi:hypothetical protein
MELIDHATKEQPIVNDQRELAAFIDRTKSHGLRIQNVDPPRKRAMDWLQQPENQAQLEVLFPCVTPDDAVEVFWDNSTEPRIIQRTAMLKEFPESLCLFATAPEGKIPMIFHGQADTDGMHFLNIQKAK